MKENISKIGVVSGAFLASLCCIGPIVLAALGLGGVGFIVGLEAYRPYFIGFTATALGLAFYFTYRKKEVECEDGTCKVETGSKNSKLILWSITALAAFFIAFPYINWTDDDFDFSNVSPEMTVLTLPVTGMTCESCDNAVELAVGRVNGVEGVSADYVKGEAKVAFVENSASIAEIVEAIKKLGYGVRVPESRLPGGKQNEKN